MAGFGPAAGLSGRGDVVITVKKIFWFMPTGNEIMKLAGELLKAGDLNPGQRRRMLALLTNYFERVDPQNFDRDLAEKDWVIVLCDHKGEIQGFSTQMLLSTVTEGVNVRAIFSGDTIVDKQFWGDHALVKIWAQLIREVIRRFPDDKLYWFLISMGYKTYRYLPVYFYSFYPCGQQATPAFEQKILDRLAGEKFGPAYRRQDGVIHYQHPRECLRPGVADISAARLQDPHIKFFVERNPHFGAGDELACLVELKADNMKPFFRRIVFGRPQKEKVA